MEQLIQEGIPLEKLSNVQDVVQLFGYYWNFRIDAKKDSKKREAILKKAVTAMVKSNNLTVNIKFLRTPKRLDTYESLLSDQVLRVSSDSENLALFNHNILFDYAVSKLLIKEIPEEAYRFLTRGPSRPVFIRPSIDYFFARLWFDNRKLFWEVFWYFLYQKKEEYLHLMPMLCLVNEIQYLGDFQPILDKLKNKNSLKYQFYLLMLKRIFQTLKSIKKDIIPERDNVWIEILFKLNSFLSVKFIDEYLRLLANAINKWSDWQRDEQNKIAFMSRAILWWAWEPPSELNQRQIKKLHEVVAVWGVPLVCKTYTENPKESKELLSKILFRLGPTSTISEIYILVQEIERIWSCDPEFAVQIYKAVFSYEEKSEEKTLMTGGVLTLTSTRRQDYRMCYYSLAESFPKFLNDKPFFATEAMVRVINKIVKRVEILKYSREIISSSFRYNKITATYLPDKSYIWDENDFNNERKKILSSFDNYIFENSKDKSKRELINSLVKQIAKMNEVAVVWRHLLKTAIRNAETLTPILYPLLLAEPILTNLETNYEVGELLKIGFDYLSTEQRKTVEKTILKLSKEEEKNNLLVCIPGKYLQMKESKNIITKLKKHNEIYPNIKPFKIETSWKSNDEKDWLEEEGVNFSDNHNKNLLDLYIPIKEFHESYLNKIPELSESEKIFSRMIKLNSALEDMTLRYHPNLIKTSLTHLVSACETIARNSQIPSDHKILKFIEEIFQKAGRDASPEYNEKYHKEFNHPAWSPSPRVEAAQGIMHLIKRKEFTTEANLNLIRDLAKDKVPGVRYQIISNLSNLYYTAQKIMWSIAENTSKNENTNGVLTALANSISQIANSQIEKVLDLLEIICKRKSLEERSHITLIDPCLSTITSLKIARNNERADNIIKKFEEDPLAYALEIKEVVLTAKEYLLIGIVIKWKEKPKEVRKRAREILSRALDSSKKGFEELRNKYGESWPEDRQKKTRNIYEIIDTIGTWLYFNSDTNETIRKQGKIALNETQKRQYYFEIKPLIKKVILVGKDSLLNARTAHYIMELCNGVLKYDPAGVVEIAKELCIISAEYDYTLDPIAIKEVVDLIQTCMADYKEIFQDNRNLQNLKELLNIFIKAGWPEAIQLAINLNEIWR